MSTIVRLSVLALSILAPWTSAQTYTGPEDQRIRTELVLQNVTVGASLTPSGRTFLVISHADGTTGPGLVEYDRSTNTSTPFPNLEWNSYSAGKDPSTHLITVNSQRIGPDGNLYIVDTGATGFGQPVMFPGGPKLVQVNLTTNTVSKVYSMANATRTNSFLDDVRFNPTTGFAYLTDAGAPGLIVLRLSDGETRRVLDDDISIKGFQPVSAEGQFLRMDGKPMFIYADQLEVSPDGQTFYFQPCSGGMSTIATSVLEAAFYNSSMNANAVLDPYVAPFALTPSTGGTAIDAKGNLYVSDTDSQRIIKICPDGTMTTLVQDPRLLWVDAMWIAGDGRLWMPAAQLNRGAVFNNGTNYIQKPVSVYSIDIGTGPSPIDHA